MRAQALTAVKAGITRLRSKGGASSDSLFDLLNGYVTAARAIKNRPGSRIEFTIPPGTKGMVFFKGKFVVFANDVVTGLPDGVEVEVLRHPTNVAAVLVDIHFATPFLGYLYVVAEFDTGDVFHYWLESGEAWQAGKIYLPGDVVTPSDPNGIAYRLVSDTSGYEVWTPNVSRSLGDQVVPTTDNGFFYTVTEVSGDSARSGTTEPDWPAIDGATVYEDANLISPLSANTTTTTNNVPSSVSDRYGTGTGS